MKRFVITEGKLALNIDMIQEFWVRYNPIGKTYCVVAEIKDGTIYLMSDLYKTREEAEARMLDIVDEIEGTVKVTKEFYY